MNSQIMKSKPMKWERERNSKALIAQRERVERREGERKGDRDHV
jgi:hypothetical protein